MVVEDAPHSLSAMSLNDDYYMLLQGGTVRVQGLPVLDLEHLPLFKMKVWFELVAARQRGEHVNTRDITKHKNDVFRLVTAIDPGTHVRVPGLVAQDVRAFLDAVNLSRNDLSNLGIRGYSPEELRFSIEEIYAP